MNDKNALDSATRRGNSRDADLVAALDIAFQDAVKRNNAEAIDEILHEDFALVLGDGRVVSRDDVLEEARSGEFQYDVQDEEPGSQTVRLWNDTAVVTALLRIQGRRRSGEPFDRRLWFSDTYVRTPEGWRYAFAQASLPLPPAADRPEGGGVTGSHIAVDA